MSGLEIELEFSGEIAFKNIVGEVESKPQLVDYLYALFGFKGMRSLGKASDQFEDFEVTVLLSDLDIRTSASPDTQHYLDTTKVFQI